MSNLQYLPKASITSNSHYFYHTAKATRYENSIKLKFEGEKNLQLDCNNLIHLQPHLAYKESEINKSLTYSSFDKAKEESLKTEEYFRYKHKITEGKRLKIEEIVRERDRKIKEDLEMEKFQLKSVLIRIIKDTLKFTKESTPMISMMPNRLYLAINQITEEKKARKNPSLGSISLDSLTTSNNSTSIKKYESNSFLKELGLNLNNLNQDNINIDIDKAYEFVKKWKINREDVNQVIRIKVVNELMNVEERRSVNRIRNIQNKISKYREEKMSKRENHIKQMKDESGISRISKDKNTDVESKGASVIIKDRKIQNKEIIDKNKKSHPSGFLLRNFTSTSSKSINTKKQKEVHECMQKIYGSENASSLTHFEKRKIREKCPLCNHDQKYKKMHRLNAYNNVDKIVRYIDSNEELRENQNLSKHFKSIKFNKKFDDVTKNLMSEYNDSLCITNLA